MKNRDPMELGLQYSWRYWESVQRLNAQTDGGVAVEDIDQENRSDDAPEDQWDDIAMQF